MRRVLTSASAGTGKTYRICEEVAQAVVKGLEPHGQLLDPARLLGVTFTTKAAAELKARVQQRLLTDPALPLEDRIERAERLELAALGTVHSVGHRLVQKYALRLGLSPDLQVLDEVSSEQLLDEALTVMPQGPWEELVKAGERLEIHDPKRLAKALLELQRTNRLPSDAVRRGLEEGAARVCQLLSASGPDATAVDPRALYDEAEKVLRELEGTNDQTGATKGAIEKLRDLLAKRSGRWGDGALLMGLEAAKGRNGNGPDRFLAPLRAFAGQVRRMPGLHQDVRVYASLLAEQTQALKAAYEDRKRQRGALDFPDLEELFLRLLEDPALAEDLRASFDLVVIDEFQDTNPMQLALFVRLHELVGNSVWVGDEKQAIYGFRGADSELMENVWSGGDAVFGARSAAPDLLAETLQHPGDERVRLLDNYRSQTGLVAVFNALFVPVFGAEAALEATRPARPRAVERWRFRATTLEEEFTALATGLARLREEGTPLRDIAVLARTNDHAKKVGNALRGHGLPVVTPLPGLLKTRECAAALAGLKVVVDRRDGVACAEVLHLLGDASEETPAWFERRLREVAAGEGKEPFTEDPLLARLKALPARSSAPADALAAVFTALDLPARIPAWGNPGQRAAHLDGLLALAKRLEERALAEGRAPTLAGLVADLDAAGAKEQDDFPVPQGIDAVTVLTYHGAKGLEWPTVILTDLNATLRPDPWRPRATGGNAKGGRPLEGRALQAWIWPFGIGKHPLYARRQGGSGLEDDALASVEGLAVQAAEEQEIRRLLYVGMTRARDRLVLAHRWSDTKGALCKWLDVFPHGQVLPTDLPEGEHPVLDGATTLRVRDLGPEPARTATPGLRWLAEPAAPGLPLVPRHVQPSALPAVAGATFGPAETLGPRARVKRDREEDEYERLGNAVHAYLAALPSLAGLESAQHLRVAERCLANFASQTALAAPELVAVGERLRAWVAQKWPGATWHTEVPVTAPRAEGGTWTGSIDLLLELPDGHLVVLDHKSVDLFPTAWAAKALEHSGQLRGYRTILEAQGATVAGCWIHFPLAGGALPLLP